MRINRGVASALSAGVLFGASTPVAKRLNADIDPWMLAGLLYLGSGIGLSAFNLIRYEVRGRGIECAPLAAHDRRWLAAAIISGGLIAPVLMMYGLRLTAGSSASLLLNLEGVFSVLLAWFVFKESFDRRVAFGVLAITGGAIVLSVGGGVNSNGAIGAAAITGACLAWGLDNNFTRKVALNDVGRIAMLKGLVAGAVNVAIASAAGARLPNASIALAAGLIGLLGYGLSLMLFVLGLRHLGAARASAYFSIAPFVGALIAVIYFEEPFTVQLMWAGVLMGFGVWLHASERHDHEHTHEQTTHDHAHTHDEHHQHLHDEKDWETQPHSHAHTHQRLRHSHPHYPDEHHRHAH
jgi:drug/metabolite transporter (DMT)-like permease